jgi:membrane associated rhomboid family serine protease
MARITPHSAGYWAGGGTAVSISDGAGGARGLIRTRGLAGLASLRIAAEVTALVLAAIWLVQGVNVLDGYGLDISLGARPRDLATLPYILLAPLLHYGLGHIESNTPPLAILTFLTALGGVKRYLYVTGIVVLFGGFGTWLISPSGVVSVGASGLIFGYLGYLIVRGLFARSVSQALWRLPLGVVLVAYYKWTIVLLHPSAVVSSMRISWQAHLCGLLSGILVAFLAWRRGSRLDDPKPVPRPGA